MPPEELDPVERIDVVFVNGAGGGFRETVRWRSGGTILQFFEAKLPDSSPDSHKIRVNNEAVSSDYVLANGDVVSVSPVKVQGA